MKLFIPLQKILVLYKLFKELVGPENFYFWLHVPDSEMYQLTNKSSGFYHHTATVYRGINKAGYNWCENNCDVICREVKHGRLSFQSLPDFLNQLIVLVLLGQPSGPQHYDHPPPQPWPFYIYYTNVVLSAINIATCHYSYSTKLTQNRIKLINPQVTTEKFQSECLCRRT